MTKSAPLPASGGSYLRDPETGALTPADAVLAPEAAPTKSTVKGAVKAPSKEG